MHSKEHEIFLFNELKQGKTYAFEFFFHYYFPGLCVYAQNLMSCNLPDAQNIVQDIFMKVWEEREKISIQTSIKSYLFVMVRNKCFDTMKKKGYNKTGQNIADIHEPVEENYDTYILSELESIFNKGLEKLPEKCREVFELSRLKGLKNKEIARELNISEKTVENQMTKALKILRTELKDYLPLLLLFPHFNFLN